MAFTPVSLQSRIKAGVATLIEDLNLKVSGGIESLTVADETNVSLPCVMVTLGEAEQHRAMTLAGYGKIYSVRVFIYDNDETMAPEDEDRWMTWREEMMVACHHPPRTYDYTGGLKVLLPSCPEVNTVEVKPRAVVDERLPQYKKIVSGFVVEATASIGRER